MIRSEGSDGRRKKKIEGRARKRVRGSRGDERKLIEIALDVDDDRIYRRDIRTYRSNSYARSRARVPWLKPVT